MLIYFGMLSIPSLFSILAPKSKNFFIFLVILIVFVVIIGLRENIGMDWNNYLAIHGKMRFLEFKEVLYASESASNSLFWVSNRYFSGIYSSNIVAAIILTSGVLIFSSKTSEPWLSIVSSVPYLCIVVGMSATRQAMAIGVVFAVFAFWHEFGIVRKAAAIFVASLFHTSAIFICGFLVNDLPVNFAFKLIIGSAIAAAGVYFLSRAGIYAGQLDFYAESYLSAQGQIVSPGALAHVALVAMPAVVYLFMRNRIFQIYDKSNFLDVSALICIALVPAAFFFSTAASRFSIYMQFFPMIFYPALVDVYKAENIKTAIRLGVVALNLIFLFVWLLYANNSFAYKPYRNIWWE